MKPFRLLARNELREGERGGDHRRSAPGCEGSSAIDDFSAADVADYGPSSGIPGAARAISIRRGQKDASIKPLLCMPSPASHGAAVARDAPQARRGAQTFHP
jgi:hypothetical protein